MPPKTISVSFTTLYPYFLIVFLFLVPFTLNQSQIITGTIVNCLLLLSAPFFPFRQRLFLCTLPSLAAISHNFLFAHLTPYLLLFLPAIWLGNLLFITIPIKFPKNIPLIVRQLIGAIIKTLLLFSVAKFFVLIHLVPAIFITTMGLYQLITAIVGIIAYQATTLVYAHSRP